VNRPRVLSYGGGLDSFAMLVDAIARDDRPDVVCFVDVGDPAGEDPGEWPETLEHIRTVVQPLCAREGIEFVWITSDQYPVRDARSLFAWMEARGQIPVAGPNRICTRIAKVERFEAWLDDRFPGREAEVWIGFEAGEEERAKRDPNAGRPRKPGPTRATRVNAFPLMERGMCRCRCEARITELGYALPSGSACQFCPYGTKLQWQLFARTSPGKFARTVALEANKPPTSSGKKLSIMGYRAVKDRAGNKVGYKAPPLPQWIEGGYRGKRKPCEICGAAERARKLMGCEADPRAGRSRLYQLPLLPPEVA
jgi:hypothetical protein